MGKFMLLNEHDFTPGTTYENVLLWGSCGGILNEMIDLNESTDSKVTTVKFRGKFQEADAINKNKRVYSYDVLDKNIKRLQEAISNNGLIGELDHPADSILHFRDASHKITKLWWEGKVLMGEGVILSTPMGRILRSLINDGVRIGVSSRGVGSGTTNENGILVISENYRLVTFDTVADPSTYEAYQEKVSSTKRESVISQNNFDLPIKNEDSRLYNNNKTAKAQVIASLGGIINELTTEFKARLS